MDWSFSSKDSSRGMKGSKLSPNHDGQARRCGKTSYQREKLGLSGALSRKPLLKIRREGFGKGFLDTNHLSWACKYVNNYVGGRGHSGASR